MSALAQKRTSPLPWGTSASCRKLTWVWYYPCWLMVCQSSRVLRSLISLPTVPAALRRSQRCDVLHRGLAPLQYQLARVSRGSRRSSSKNFSSSPQTTQKLCGYAIVRTELCYGEGTMAATKELTSGQKAAQTRKRRATALKAAATRKRRATAAKAAATRKKNKAAAARKTAAPKTTAKRKPAARKTAARKTTARRKPAARKTARK